MKCSALILTLLAAALLPATASADAVVAPAPGATSLAAGGGYHAWLAPADAPGLQVVVYTAAAGSETAARLRVLAGQAAGGCGTGG